MTKIGVILSGCGYLDGSEINEAILTLLALDRAGVTVVALAPDVEAAQVTNHYNGEESRGETRDVLAESARLVRGKITSLKEVSAHDLDGLIIVGGYGAAQNLCTFANDGAHAVINPDAGRLIEEIVALGKPLGAMCIAPVVVALALKDRENAQPAILTIGNDSDTLAAIESWGSKHQVTTVDQVCIDETNKIASTPAYMLATGPAQAETGINKLVDYVVSTAQTTNALYRNTGEEI